MRKQFKYIIIAISIVAVLGLSLFFLLKIPPKDSGGASSSSASSTEVVLISKEQTDIKKIHVKNTSATFNCEVNDTDIKITELSSYSQDNSALTSLTTQAASITALKKVADSVENLSDFGFDNPTAQIEITFKDETVFKLDVGGETSGGYSYYIKEKDSSAIYTISEYSISSFLDPLTSFIDKTLTATIAEDAQTNIDNIIIGGSARQEISIRKYTEEEKAGKTEYETYTISSPINESLNTDIVSSLLASFSGVTASEVVTLDVSAESLKHFGLDNPKYTLTFTYDGTTGKLLFGNKDDEENYYVMKNGGNVIYKIPASSFGYLEYGLNKFVSNIIINSNIDTIKSVTVKYDGGEYKFNLSGDGQELKVLSGETAIDTDIFRNFYELLLNLTYEGTASKPSSSSALTVTYEYEDGTKQNDVIEFLPFDSRQYFVNKNGTGYFYILKPYIDKIIDSVQKVNSNQAITKTY